MSRVKMPSVTISIRVLRETLEPKRTRKPTVSPTRSPSVCAIALRGGARRQPARFEHQDAAALGPGRFGQHQRNPGGLAGAGRRHQHGRIPGGERRGQFRQRAIDRKRRVIHSDIDP